MTDPLERFGADPIGVDRLVDPGVIRLLLLIEETGRFSAAADRLGVTQSSVSQQVKRIERHVGRPVFRRARRGIRLTRDGEAVIVYARAMLGLTRDLRARLMRASDGIELSIAMSEDACRTALPAVLGVFVIDQPQVRLRVLSGTYDLVAEAVENRSVDFAITRRWDRFPDAELLFTDEMSWFGGHGLALPVPDPVPLVLPLPPNPSRDTTLDVLARAGRSSVVRFESVGVAGIETAIGAGLGVCAGPRSMSVFNVARLPEGHGLPALPQVDFVLVRAGPSVSDAGQAFAELIRQTAKSRFVFEDD